MRTDVLPPHDEQSEMATLGSLLVSPDFIAPISAALVPEDFYLESHRMIYQALLDLGEGADLITVGAELERTNKLDEIGGQSYLARLTNEVATALNVQQYSRTVLSYSLRRKMIDAANRIAQVAYDGSADDDKLISTAQTSISRAIHHHAQTKAMAKTDAISAWRESFNNLIETGIIPGVATGIREFDYKLGGLKPGKLYIFAGNSGTGKTTIMMNLLLNAARSGANVAMFSCEMTEPELVEVAVANIAARRLAAINLNEGHIVKLDTAERERIREAAIWASCELENLPIELRCYPGMTPAQLRYEAKSLKQGKGLDVLAADYIQIMISNVSGKDINHEREISSIAEDLKRLAMDDDLRVAVLAGSQVNADGDLRESKAIGHHADVVVTLKSNGINQLTASFIKNRRGPTGDVDLIYKKEAASIRGVANDIR